jgi:hypothetical protein
MLWGNNVAATNICPGLYLFNQCGGDVPIVKQWPARKVILNKKILERLIQAIDVIDNPNKPGSTTDVGTLF